MGNVLIDFENMSWESAYPGQIQKAYVEGGQRIRIVKLSDEYAEEDWCDKEHIGYVLEGRILIEFAERSITLKKGDGIFIPKGEEYKHKGRIAKGEEVSMIFFEKV